MVRMFFPWSVVRNGPLDEQSTALQGPIVERGPQAGVKPALPAGEEPATSTAARIALGRRRRTRQRAPENARLATVAKPSSSARRARSRRAGRGAAGGAGGGGGGGGGVGGPGGRPPGRGRAAGRRCPAGRPPRRPARCRA